MAAVGEAQRLIHEARAQQQEQVAAAVSRRRAREVTIQAVFLGLHFAAVIHHGYRLFCAMTGRPMGPGF